MTQPFDSQTGLNSRDHAAFVESTGVPGQSARVVVGPGGGPVPVVVSGGGLPALTPGSGQVNVTTPLTAVPLAGAATQADRVVITAKLTNTMNIYLGDSGVTPANGFIMEPGRDVTLETADLNTLFIDADVGTEGVSFVSLT